MSGKSLGKQLTRIKKYVERETGIEDISSKNRDNSHARARMLYGLIALNSTKCTMSQIGEYIKRDHSTIVHYRDNSHLVYNDEYYMHIYLSYDQIKDKQMQTIYQTNIQLRKKIIELQQENKFLNSQKCDKHDLLTRNEVAYRKLNDEQKKIYDMRTETILQSFKWSRQNNKGETFLANSLTYAG